jgi:hypothetical protein
VAGCSKRSSSKAAGSEATEAYPRGTSQGDARLRTTLGTVFSSLLGEMGYEPMTNRCSHLLKVFSPGELVIGVRQEIQPLWTS